MKPFEFFFLVFSCIVVPSVLGTTMLKKAFGVVAMTLLVWAAYRL